jgi:hypothetical protein
MNSSLIVFVTLAFCVVMLGAEKCYECNSNTNEYCEKLENPAKVDVKDCEQGVTHCRKIIQTGNLIEKLILIYRTLNKLYF